MDKYNWAIKITRKITIDFKKLMWFKVFTASGRLLKYFLWNEYTFEFPWKKKNKHDILVFQYFATNCTMIFWVQFCLDASCSNAITQNKTICRFFVFISWTHLHCLPKSYFDKFSERNSFARITHPLHLWELLIPLLL